VIGVRRQDPFVSQRIFFLTWRKEIVSRVSRFQEGVRTEMADVIFQRLSLQTGDHYTASSLSEEMQ
jgi:hypothetical protein